jgi:uncharacterized protein (DUF885 family)
MKTYLFLVLMIVSIRVVNAQSQVNSTVTSGIISQVMNEYNVGHDDLNRVYIFKDSPEYYQRLGTYYNNTLQKLATLNFNGLKVSDKVDYILFKRNVTQAKSNLEQSEKLFSQISYTVPFVNTVYRMQAARRRGNTVTSPEEFASTLNTLKNEIGKAKKEVEKTPAFSASSAKKAGEVIDGLRRGIQNTYSFYNAYDPLFTWWAKKPYDDVDTALATYSAFIKNRVATESKVKDDGSGIIGDPIGSDALKQQLEFEMIPYSAEELVEIANKEFAWCDAEMLKASRQMGFGDDWKKALEKVKQNYVQPGRQPELVNNLAEEAIAFLEKNNLVTIPAMAKEVWRMNMLTEAQQRLAPFFLGGESILIGFPTDKMDHESKVMSMRSNNYGFSHATVFHELIPGHNLQFYMNRRYKTYRSDFRTPFSSEGWALYWEMLLWDKNFHDTPEEKIGALFWRMHRCARIIFSSNYHLGKWTPQQCIDFLVERVGHERFSAEGEVRRSFTGGYGPLYQIAYMIGGLQLRALYNEVVATKKMTEKQFHDTFLQENTIPIEMFRAIVTDQKLSENYKTQWRFATNLK